MRIIPTLDLADYEIVLQLDDVSYRLKFSWNIRGEYWELVFKDINGNVIVTIKLVLNFPLFAQFTEIGLPPGELMAIDTTGKLDSIGRDDFNSAVKLIYITGDELGTI